MQPMRDQDPSHHNHRVGAGPAVDVHGRVITANQRAAARYRQAQRAADSRLATTALRLAVYADPAFGLAAADLNAITGTASQIPSHRQMNWERHHIEVVRAAAADNARRAADLLREHLASAGCDPLAFRIAAMLRQPTGKNDDFENLASQLPGCHTTPWPRQDRVDHRRSGPLTPGTGMTRDAGAAPSPPRID